MDCEHCKGKSTVLRYRKGAKRMSTVYICDTCKHVWAVWVDNDEALDKRMKEIADAFTDPKDSE